MQRYDFFMTKYIYALTLCLVLSACSSSPKESGETFASGGARGSTAQFRYNELMIKDYDEMSHMVNAKLKKARSVGSNSSDENVDDQEALENLREAVKLILSRPDSDNMVAKLMPEVRKELLGYNAFEDTLSGLAAEAVAVAKDDNVANSAQATALVVLENLLAQIRPEVGSNTDLRRIAEKIKNARISISTGVRKDLKLRGMFVPKNPSELAKDILKAAPLKKVDKKSKKPTPEEED